MRKQYHVVHLVYRFAAGGLENVIVQLINGLPRDEFRHTVVALSEADPGFIARIERKDVEVLSLRKKPGQPFAMYPGMYRLLRRLRPDVLHSCNLAALEFMPVAWMAGVRLRVHAEHGWDIHDPDGSKLRYRLLRRLYRPFVHTFVAVSAQLRDYLRNAVGVANERLHLLPNGVDCERFHPGGLAATEPEGWPFHDRGAYVIGTVGRLEPIKNQALLVDAFVQLAREEKGSKLRLAIVGDGPLREQLAERVAAAGLADRVWLSGSRSDIPELLRMFDCFVLPSLREGTSCTLQEAMATGVPIVATDVGGNADLLEHGTLARLTPSGDAAALAEAIQAVIDGKVADPNAVTHAVRERHSLAGMLSSYAALYRSR